ncbi:hypothetical protein ENUP19_0054G0111 [Entamoeba nuttalli]|uniref:AIG1 family protein n=1 Tax=Entamoeba nuttalli TaxID=412467 RepID=A0ABQ0DCE2_9EUKA
MILDGGKLKNGIKTISLRYDGFDAEWYHLEYVFAQFKTMKLSQSCIDKLKFKDGEEEHLKQFNTKYWESKKITTSEVKNSKGVI